MKNWYATKTSNIHDQGLVVDEDTGENIAVSYKMENAPVLAAAPDLFESLNELVELIAYDTRLLYNIIGRERWKKADAAVRKAMDGR
jgi:hypothetical protein